MAQRIEATVDAGAAALLGGAALFAAFHLGLPMLLAVGWGLLAGVLCFWLLRSVDVGDARYPDPQFAVAAFQPEPPVLLLDDMLADVGEDSRVVRLFEPSAAPRAAPPDASQALYEALAKLRRSLR